MKTSYTSQAVTSALILITLNALVYLPPVYRWAGADVVLWINNLTNVGAALISTWLGFRLWRSFQRGEIQRLVWGSFLAGLILWTIAEIIWDSYQLFYGTTLRSASLVDIFWILGYIAMIIGLVLRLHTFKMRLTKTWQYACLAVFGVLVVLATIYLIIPAMSATQTGISYQKFVDLFYPVGDVVLAFLALVLVLLLEGGLLSRPWATIALGCFCIAASDLLYAFALSHGIYQIDPAARLDLLSYLIDTSYTFAYILVTLGLYLQARLLDAI